jgi:hypothetical protein
MIRFSGEMWLNRLDERPQGSSQTIIKQGDRSICDGKYFLKTNR